MTIDFTRDIGTHVITRQPVDCGQWLVWMDGRVVGYLGDERDSPLNLIERFVPYVQEQLAAAAEARFGWKPAVNQPPQMPRGAKRRPRW